MLLYIKQFINFFVKKESNNSGGGGGGSLCSCLGKKKGPVNSQEFDRIEAAFRSVGDTCSLLDQLWTLDSGQWTRCQQPEV